MKKLLLSAVFAMVALTTAFAANLNPFAYNLRSSLDANNPMQLNVSFSVNAPATSVEVVVYDVETNEVAYTQACPAYNAKHDYEFIIDLSYIPGEYRGGENNLGWRVDVKGEKVDAPTAVDKEYYFYHPRSIDIDNNPENPNFGHVFVIEGLHDITTKTGTTNGAAGKPYNKYLSWGVGAGLYVFDAAFQNLPTPNATAGYNGGLTYTAAEKISVTSNGNTHNYNVYAPNRVKVSDDGRVFITLCAPVNRGILLEADKYIFSNAEDRPANWSATSWKKVLVGTRDANTEELEDANGNFIAALNCDIDTKGSGKDLQIMLLSGTKNALLAIADQYTFSEYKLGENPQWNSAPTKTWKLDNAVVAYNVVEIVYDNEGGYWMCQDRRNKDEVIKYPTLMHVNKDGVVDLKEKMMNRGGAGICFNKDFTKLIVSGKSSTSPISGVSSASSYSTGTLAWATIYAISKVNGAPKLTMEYEIDMTSLGNNIPGFAWDHANNIYACGYSYEKLKAWALPHGADEVISTPAASRYRFDLSCEDNVYYAVSISCNPERGSVTMNAEGMVDGKVPSCSNVTVVATAKENYEFVCWKKGEIVVSNSASYTFFAMEDNVHLTAHFEGIDCSVTWWNLFENGEDIAKESISYPNTNERLWRLFQLFYYDYASGRGVSLEDKGTIPVNITKSSYIHFACVKSLNSNGSNVKDYVMSPDKPFYWMSEYWSEHKLDVTLPAGGGWIYFTNLFFNRSDSTYNSDEQLCNNMANGAYNRNGSDRWTNMSVTWDSFIEYGKSKHWRPWYTDFLGLRKTMSYGSHLPVTWKQYDVLEGTVNGLENSKENTPSQWHIWNKVTSIPNGHDDTHILAWRNGSVEGDIVHHVTQDGMKLYATYVNKTIDENDEDGGPTKYDASNEDVIKLMQNPNYGVGATHILQVKRNLQAGMYNTICLPFDVELNGLMDGHPLKGATLLSFSSIDDNLYNQSGEPVTVLNFTEVPEVTIGGKPCRILQAGIPYLIKVHEDVDEAKLLEEMRFTGIGRDVLILNAYSSETYRGVTFHGTINPTNIPEGSLILVADNRLALTTETGQMLGLRGYFTIDPMMASDIAEQAADGRVYLSFQKPTTTSIPVAPEAEQQKQPKVRKVMYNGQIYILRGDEVYTITGTRVK